MHVDGLVGTSIWLVPYLGEELALAHHPAGPFNEIHQQLKLPSGEGERLALKDGFLGIEVDGDLSDGDCPLLRIRPRAAQNSAEARFEVLRRVGFHDVVVCAGVEQSNDSRLVVPSGCDNDGHIGDRPDHAQRLGSVKIRKTKVKHHDVESPRHRGFDTGHSGPDGIDVMASLCEPTRQRLPDPLIVFNYQNGRHGATIPNSRGADRTSGPISPAVNQPLAVQRPESGIIDMCDA